MMQQEHPISVEDTNEEALASKISAARKGYIKDNFAEEFARFKGNRDIIMHRGYWARVFTIKKLVEAIISLGNDTQIVALGAGLETLWLNMQEQNKLKNSYSFVQLDLASVVERKINKIQKSAKIQQFFQEHNLKQELSQDKQVFQVCNASSRYNLATCDLSQVEQFQTIMNRLGIDPNKPTLLYAECVFSYIQADKVDALLQYISSNFKLAFVFDYEMYDPNDRFGQMMVSNFKRMGCDLVGIYKYPGVADQFTRFDKNCGFKRTECLTMARIYYDCIEKGERQKIEKLEMLDELQEWNLIMGHYFGLLSVAYSQDAKDKVQGFDRFVDEIRLQPKGE